MRQVVLSFTDMWQALKRGGWLILYSALFFGSLSFGYSLLKPPTFTAQAVFKGGSQTSGNTFTKALELIGGGESYSASEDPKVFLRSYPVMEEVVLTLHLQLAIAEQKRGNPLHQIWETMKAERAQRVVKKRSPPSPILSVPVVSKPILADRPPLLRCVELHYPGLTSADCSLSFIDEKHFEVNGTKGELGKSFVWEGGAFTLEATGEVAGKSFDLSFIPLEAAARSLEKGINVKRSKDHQSLVNLSFTHTDRHLATAIVNCTMEAFQHYLKEEGKRKISKQLSYLQQRQGETVESLEKAMEEYKCYLESHLNSGGMFSLEDELEFMALKQASSLEKLDEVAAEMQRIHQVLAGSQILSFPDLLEQLRNEPSQNQTLSQEGAAKLILDYERSLDLVRMEQEQYDYCLKKLLEPDFDTSALSKVIDDPTLRSRFDKMHTLHHNLLDEKNWTSKERELLREDLEMERIFLVKHIGDLKEGASLKEEVLKGRLRHLQETMLLILRDLYNGTKEGLRSLANKASHFPQKWLIERKIELNTKLHTELIESITKMIEAKNISYHLDYLSSTPLMRATLPFVPNSPQLLFKFIVGCLSGGFFIAASLLLREIWLGPTVSLPNLKSLGKHVLPSDELKEVHYYLKKRGKRVAVIAKDPSLAHNLSKGEKLITHSSAPLTSLECRELIDSSDQVVVVLQEERWNNVPELPTETLFLIEVSQKKTLSLKEIVPLLDRLTSFVFSRQKPPLEPQQTENYTL